MHRWCLTAIPNKVHICTMTPDATIVQLRRKQAHASLWATVGNPVDIGRGQVVEKIQVFIPLDELEFLRQFALYRNTLARLTKQTLKQAWSRKSMAEHFISLGVQSHMAQLAAMFDACGPLPTSEDREAMEAYVRRVLAWDKKSSKGTADK
jgi:folate-dependent tRNA-U54 methylase TrmFO/GidA